MFVLFSLEICLRETLNVPIERGISSPHLIESSGDQNLP